MSARLAWSLVGLSSLCGLAGMAFALALQPGPEVFVAEAAAQASLSVVFPAVGALVASRQPRNACGWLLVAVGLLQGVNVATYNYGTYAVVGRAEPLPGAVAALWVGSWTWIPSLGLLAIFLPPLFPDGRLPSARWRPVVRAAGIALACCATLTAVATWPLEAELADPNAPSIPLLDALTFVALAAGAVASVTSLTVRFRRATGVERQQLKWLAFGGAGSAGGALLTFADLGLAALALTVGGLLALPVTIGMAILRLRLYEIDRIISRTLSYGVLTALLGAFYAGGVVLLGTVLRTDSDLAVAGSTLTVAALFGPARRRVQTVVDRRFNRTRYDAEQTLETLRTRLRDEVDLDDLSQELLAAVHQTVQPARASLWLREAAR